MARPQSVSRSCPYSASCFECPLPDCKLLAARALYANRLPGDVDEEKQANRCKKKAPADRAKGA